MQPYLPQPPHTIQTKPIFEPGNLFPSAIHSESSALSGVLVFPAKLEEKTW